MKARAKRTLTHAAIGCFALAAVGLRIGWFLADNVEGLARGRRRYRQDVHGIATDASPEGINLQQPERAA